MYRYMQKLKQSKGVERFRHITRIKSERVRSGTFFRAPNKAYSVWQGIGTIYNDLKPVNRGAKLSWRALTDHKKFLYSSQVIAEQGGYGITAKINPKLLDTWVDGNHNIYDCIRKRIGKQLRNKKLNGIQLGYVIEGKTKKGCRTDLHLHGMFSGIDRFKLGSVKAAIEEALEAGPFRGGKGSHLDVKITPYQDMFIFGEKRPMVNGQFIVQKTSCLLTSASQTIEFI